MDEVNKKYSGKSKSSHDLIKDPKLSSEPAVNSTSPKKGGEKRSHETDSESDENDSENERKVKSKRKEKPVDDAAEDVKEEKRENIEKEIRDIRDKLKRKHDTSTDKKSDPSRSASSGSQKKTAAESDDEEEYYLGKDEKMKQKQKVEDLRKEYKQLRKSMKKEQEEEKKEAAASAKETEDKATKLATENNVVKEFLEEQEKYKQIKTNAPKKGEDREALTLKLLAKFKSKIEVAKETSDDKDTTSSSKKDEEEVHGKKKGKSERHRDLDDDEEEESSDDISWYETVCHSSNQFLPNNFLPKLKLMNFLLLLKGWHGNSITKIRTRSWPRTPIQSRMTGSIFMTLATH